MGLRWQRRKLCSFGTNGPLIGLRKKYTCRFYQTRVGADRETSGYVNSSGSYNARREFLEQQVDEKNGNGRALSQLGPS